MAKMMEHGSGFAWRVSVKRQLGGYHYIAYTAIDIPVSETVISFPNLCIRDIYI